MKKVFPQRLALVLNATTVVLFLVASISGVAIAAPQISDQNQGQPKKPTGNGLLTAQKINKSFSDFKQNQPLIETEKAESNNENSKRNQRVDQKPVNLEAVNLEAVNLEAVNLEAVKEIENIRQQLGLAIFSDQKGSSLFKAQVGKLMSEDAKASAQVLDLQNPLLAPPSVRKATNADFPATPKTTPERTSRPTTTKPKTRGKQAHFAHPLPAMNGAAFHPHHQNVRPQIPPMMQTQSNSAPWPTRQAGYTPGNPHPTVVVYGTPTLSPLNIESKVQQTINVLYDSVGELDRTALAFERAGENARADVFRQLSKALREQIVETKLRLQDADHPTAKDSGTLVD
jgi:hypothetical protein